LRITRGFLIILLSLNAIFSASCCSSDQIPSFIRLLNSSDAKDRNDAALALARCGEKAERAVPRLSQLLYDDNVGVQSAAAYALRKIDTPSARAIMNRIDESRRQK
jgi:HEAT repeat protein